MNRVKTNVEAGICGFKTEVTANSEDTQNVSFDIITDCETIGKLAKDLTEVDSYNEIKEGFEGKLYGIIRKNLKGCCSGCAVPVGIFKSMQVAANLALPKDVTIKIKKEEP